MFWLRLNTAIVFGLPPIIVLVMAVPSLRDSLWIINLATLLGLWLPAVAGMRADKPNPEDE